MVWQWTHRRHFPLQMFSAQFPMRPQTPKRMQAAARMASVVSSTLPACRRLIRETFAQLNASLVMISLPKTARQWLYWMSVCYVLGFIALWIGGGYILTESGRVRTFMDGPTGIAAPDIAQWQPLVGHFQRTYHWPTEVVSPRCDFIGWAYFPLLSVVASRHPTVALLDDRGQIITDPVFPQNFRLHPLRGRQLAGVIRQKTVGTSH